MTQFTTAILADPTCYQLGTCAPHAAFSHYASLEECQTESSSFCCSLNGTWQFCAVERADAVPACFQEATFSEMQVPGHLQLQGYGTPQYVNVMYPWDGVESCKPGEIPEKNRVGCYKRLVTLPEQLQKAHKVHLVFHGAETALALWINGSFVGYHEDSFTPAEFDITPYIKGGSNEIAVAVFQRSSGSWLEDQDFWRFSGLFRDVELWGIPRVHVRDFFVQTSLSPSYDAAEIQVKLDMDTVPGALVEAALFDPSGALLETKTVPASSGTIRFSVSSPKLWSAETPWLYALRMTVRDKAGIVQEIIPQEIGIREFRMQDGLMQLNGKRLVFCGVNRHEFSAKTGRVVSKEEMRQDVALLKRQNVNAVRTCHYPNSAYFYTLCDRYGLYVIDETNLETHGTWQKRGAQAPDANTLPGDLPQWKEAVLARGRAMLERDKNHPCVLFWSCGNESFGGSNLLAMAQQFRQLDPSRLVHYEGIFHDRRYPDTSDIESQMYPPASQIREFLECHPEKPFLCCEYAHSMGNSTGGLGEYTELAWENPRYQGGFLWDYIDQALLQTDESGETWLAVGGDLGDRPSDYNFCTNGIVFADRTPSPKLSEVKFCYQPFRITGTQTALCIQNRLQFTSADAYTGTWILCRNGAVQKQLELPSLPAIPPGKSGMVPVPFAPADTEEAGEYVLTLSVHPKEKPFWAEETWEAAFGQVIWQPQPQENLPKPAPQPAPKLIVGDANYGIQTQQASFLFSRERAGLSSWRGKDGVEKIAGLCGIPRPNFWRAPTENDQGWQSGFACGMWKLASLYAQSSLTSCRQTAHAIQLQTSTTFPGESGGSCTVTYTFQEPGMLQVTMTLHGCESFGILPDFGLLLQMPNRFSQLRWYGRGPAESYCDRKDGCKVGIWNSTVSEQLTPYVQVQSCGNHTDVRWAEITDATGNGIVIAAEPGSTLEFSVLPYTPHQLEDAFHRRDLPVSHTSVVRISAGEMGVGGDDSWGAMPHEAFLPLPTEGKSFSFWLFEKQNEK